MRFFLSTIWAVTEKDLRLEWRARESLITMLVFSLLVLTLFSFAFGPGGRGGGEEGAGTQAGILWVAFLFASVIGLSRSMGLERESSGLVAMRLSPADPSAIFLGKMLATLVNMAIMEAAGFAALAVLYRAPVHRDPGGLAVVAGVATLGISALGTLFAAVSVRTRMRDMFLPILLFPLLVPLLIAAVKATEAFLGGEGWAVAGDWVKMLGVYDMIFVTASSVMFEYVIDD